MDADGGVLRLERTASKQIDWRRALQMDELLSAAFGVEQLTVPNSVRRSFYDDFPIWRPGASSDVTFYNLVDDQHRLIATAGIRLCGLVLSGAQRPRVGLVGAVATSPESRGRGFAAQVLEALINDIKKNPLDAIVLWDSSQSTLYQRFGFVPFREEYLFRLSDFVVTEPKKKQFVFHQGWHDAIFQAVIHRQNGVKYEYRDRDWYRRHLNTKWYWLEERDTCVAWCAVHRGIDLKGVLHEWHGSPDALQRLLYEVNQREPGAILMGPSLPSSTLQHQKTQQGLILPLSPHLDWSEWWFWGLDAA